MILDGDKYKNTENITDQISNLLKKPNPSKKTKPQNEASVMCEVPDNLDI